VESASVGLILDSSVLIAGERQGHSIRQVLRQVRDKCGDIEAALSAVTVVELTHGIYRAKTEGERARRQTFADEVYRDMIVHPLDIEIAKLAGQIQAEQMARGVVIAFQDLLIGVTALHLGCNLVTLNVRHFEKIPGLRVISV
jgi:tRNA(fMet)-specific endonuclease VapC